MKTERRLEILSNVASFLKSVNINDKLLKEITTLSKNNPDQLCTASNYRVRTPVSLSLVNASDNPDKIYKVFKEVGIYNLLYVNMVPTEHTFICRIDTSEREYEVDTLRHNVNKKDFPSSKDACSLALFDFIKQIHLLK